MGVSHGMYAVVCVFTQVWLLPVRRGIDGPCMLWLWGPCMSRTGRWARPLLCVTFDLWQLLPGACHEVKGEAMAVNEADYISVFVRTVGPEERQQRCKVDVVVRRCCCSAHTGNEVRSCVGGVAEGPRRSCVHNPGASAFTREEGSSTLCITDLFCIVSKCGPVK